MVTVRAFFTKINLHFLIFMNGQRMSPLQPFLKSLWAVTLAIFLPIDRKRLLLFYKALKIFKSFF